MVALSSLRVGIGKVSYVRQYESMDSGTQFQSNLPSTHKAGADELGRRRHEEGVRDRFVRNAGRSRRANGRLTTGLIGQRSKNGRSRV